MRNLIFQQPDQTLPGHASAKLQYAWDSIRNPVIIPLLKLAVILCSGMSIMLFVERVLMTLVLLVVKVLGKKKYTKYKLDDMKQDLERNKNHPNVLIQIPMYNEREVSFPSDNEAMHHHKVQLNNLQMRFIIFASIEF